MGAVSQVASEQPIKCQLGFFDCEGRNRDAEAPESRREAGDEKSRHALASVREVPKAGLDEIAPGQREQGIHARV